MDTLPNILVVDDSPSNLHLLANLLSQNYDVRIAKNGRDCFHLLTQGYQPDLFLLDIMMPDMDGYEVCRRIKKDPNLKHIPVIFLTAKSDTIDLVQGFEVGAIDYITKPFNQLELSIRIKTHISHKLALDEINILRGIIPICANCKNIKNDKGYWQNVENYIQTHSEAVFSHTICRDCARELYPELMDEIEEEEEEQEK